MRFKQVFFLYIKKKYKKINIDFHVVRKKFFTNTDNCYNMNSIYTCA